VGVPELKAGRPGYASRLGLAFCLLGAFHLAQAQSGGITPVDLKTGMRSNPLGIQTDVISFGWALQPKDPGARSQRQTAYRILVASSANNLARNLGDVWDSGRVSSRVYWQLPYRGPTLHAHSTYYWKAEAWDETLRPGLWSASARFTTGLAEGDWTAKWIAAEKDTDTLATSGAALPVFRDEFTVRSPVKSAILFVTGLGQYELHLNGSNVTTTVLNPGWTNYRKTVPYDTYDVTSLLHRGPNAFAMLLGNGMYNVEEVKGRYTKFAGSFGHPKCRVQMEVRYQDGSSSRFVTDRSWKTHTGPIAFSSIYGGEDEDARVLPQDWELPGFQAQDWHAALEVSGPGGSMVAEASSPMVIAQTYKTRMASTPKPGVTVYDLGENMSGWPEIEVRGEAGAKVTLLPGELLAADGTVSQRSTNAFPADPVLFQYTLRGGRQERWHPRFAYHSFRYVQVSVEAASPGGRAPEVLSVAGDFVHAGVPVAGEFSTSDDLFDRIHLLIDRAVLSNLASVITDCPSREKLGWLEQTYLNAGTLMWNYDVTGLYEKMAADIADAQLDSGLVPSIAPEYVAFVDGAGKSTPFRDSPEWGSAVILSPWALYQYTGDIRPLAANYSNMQRYAAYLESRAVDGLLNYGLGDWYDIGPKPPGPSQLTSRTVTATGVFYEDLSVLARAAKLLGHDADAVEYTRKAAAVRESFNAKLFHPETDQYDRGSQTANALPLALGLVAPDHRAAVLDHLVADIHAHGDHVTSGDVGFHYVVRALTDNGRSEVLAAMFSRTDSPSYGYQLARGATTLTEAWDANPESSQNHFMLGHGEEWFYRGLAGLSVDMSQGPDDAIALRPSFLKTVDRASASYRSAMGLVRVAWQRTAESATVDVTVPAGAQAHLSLPALGGNWREQGAPAAQAAGVSSSKTSGTGTELMLILGSGNYRFFTSQASTTAAQGNRPVE
jgi:alpha-L-rhamnosidase